MKPDRWGCKADWEQELIDIAERERHDNLECDGPPLCEWCVLAKEIGEESLGG